MEDFREGKSDDKLSSISTISTTAGVTAPADKLLLMLFDGAIRFCKRANEAIEGSGWRKHIRP